MTRLSLILILMAMLCGAAVSTAADHSPSLDEVLAAAKPNDQVPVVLFLDNRIEMDDIYPTARTMPMGQRRQYVLDRLKDRFKQMSSTVMPRLEEAQANGEVKLLRPLWIVNAIRLSATPDLIKEIDEQMRVVNYIASDPTYDNTLDDGWGLIDMRAPTCWQPPYNANGSGVVVAHKDAGCDTDLPGFAGHLWVNDGEDLNHDGHIDGGDINNLDDDGNGYIDDFNGWDFDSNNNDVNDNPLGSGHGTKTGSVISADFVSCDTVSVAPGAKLMELSAFLTQSAVWEASQYAIDNGAHVMSASLSFKLSDCGQYRDCPNWVCHRWVSEMELAAGLIHANSTGNAGLSNPIPLSASAPSNCPPPAMTAAHQQQGGLSSIVSVTAYNQDGSFGTFSGVGPCAWSEEAICVNPRMPFCGPAQYPDDFNDYLYDDLHPGLAKPDLCAPTNVLCLNPNGGCSSISGTSGATPHVGGALAIIFSAFPGITPEAAYLLLVNGARDGGPVGFDSQWGFGKVSPVASCSLGIATIAHVQGLVTDFEGSLPVEGVRVSTPNSNPAYSDPTGYYELWLGAGTHTVSFEKYGLQDVIVPITLTGNQTLIQNATMSEVISRNVNLQVVGNGHSGVVPAANTSVQVPEVGFTGVTDANGELTVSLFLGTYDFLIGSLPWEEFTQTVTVTGAGNEVNVSLELSDEAANLSGPDEFGHLVYDNYDENSPGYNWIEINPNQGGEPGTNLNMSGDNTVVRTLPFTFRYFGQTYTQITVSANGFIIMGSSTSTEWGAYPIPSTPDPNNYIAPFFDDWEPQNGGAVYFYSDVVNNRVIIEWWSVPDYDNRARATFQAILHEPIENLDGAIGFQYLSYTGLADGAIGLENSDGTDGIECYFQSHFNENLAPAVDGMAYWIVPQALAIDNPSISLPRTFSLEQNYPNPFNPTTTFAWTAPHRAKVKLALYNLLGQQTVVLFDGIADAGQHEILYDATGLTSGLYFARLESEGKTFAVRKVMLMK